MSLTALAQRFEGVGRRLNRVVEWLCAGLIAVMVLVVWLGCYPQPLLDSIREPVTLLLQQGGLP